MFALKFVSIYDFPVLIRFTYQYYTSFIKRMFSNSLWSFRTIRPLQIWQNSPSEAPWIWCFFRGSSLITCCILLKFSNSSVLDSFFFFFFFFFSSGFFKKIIYLKKMFFSTKFEYLYKDTEKQSFMISQYVNGYMPSHFLFLFLVRFGHVQYFTLL